MRLSIIFASVLAVWLLLSGHYTPLLIGLGLASAGFAVWMAARAGTHDSEGLPLHMITGLPAYILWLFWQIVVSNITTMMLIFSNRTAPVIFRTPATQKSAAGIATYANSITLTPGTVTVDITKGEFIVHALSRAHADDVKSGDMDRRITAIEKRP